MTSRLHIFSQAEATIVVTHQGSTDLRLQHILRLTPQGPYKIGAESNAYDCLDIGVSSYSSRSVQPCIAPGSLESSTSFALKELKLEQKIERN